MKLSDEDKWRYGPYCDIPAFKEGYEAFRIWLIDKPKCPHDPNSLSWQAWNRGAECIMRRALDYIRANKQ